MSARLYYQDAYTTTFSTRIVEKLIEADRVAIILDHTYFYPTSGGQPADRGTISHAPVLDVAIREADGAILHWLPAESGSRFAVGEEVTAVIDWPRRFDHMQQHTGQHILSQAFIRLAEAETIGFHLSENNVTIDLDTTDLTAVQLDAAEQLANQIVWENRPIRVRFVSREEAHALPIRKIPEKNGDELRLIDIQDFDLTACGGTHVAQTGAVGLIKIVKTEKRNEKLRVEFMCGQRAWQDYGRKHQITTALAAEFTTGTDQLLDSVQRLREEIKDTQRALKKEQNERQRLTAVSLLAKGQRLGKLTLVSHAFDAHESVTLKSLASELTQSDGVIVLLGLAGAKTQLAFARSQDAPGDMKQLLSVAFGVLGQGGGGGSAQFAQGGGPAASTEELQRAIEAAQTAVIQHIQSGKQA
ncbi:MAG: alanyl-tRNA editing protein [Ardenticatenaceae bacterium]|nr:alanyl-tRNA editing protein [Ardenticatenaceae bacterium]